MNETTTEQAGELLAFDYDSQQWVDGEAARPVMIEHAQREIDLLRGKRGVEYARFTKIRNIPEAIANLEAQIVRLKAGVKL
jgi:hypothetical protein